MLKYVTTHNSSASLKRYLPLAVLGLAASLPVYAQSNAAAETQQAEAGMQEGAEKLRAIMLQQPGVTDNSDGVTLPVYPDAEVFLHYTDPSMAPTPSSMDSQSVNDDALPSITLKTSDSVEEVVAFYEEQLAGIDGFERFESDDEYSSLNLFGKGLPADLDPVRDFEGWAETIPYHEHVYIFSPDENTAIEIAYEPE